MSGKSSIASNPQEESIEEVEPVVEEEKVKIQKVKIKHERTSDETNETTLQYQHFVLRVHDHLNCLSDEELVYEVKYLKDEIQRIQLENSIYTDFLNSNEPGLLQGIQAFMDQQIKRYTMITRLSSSNVHSSTCGSASVSSSSSGLYTRLNVSQRTDLLLRALENMNIELEKFMTISSKTKHKIMADEENILIGIKEVDDALRIFEKEVVEGGADPLTGKIAAEKYVRFMNDWIKNMQFVIDKMRLRVSTSKAKYHRLVQLQGIKSEQRIGVHMVDFEKLSIENNRLAKKLEQKNQHLIELKRMTGQSNSVLTDHKNFLQNQLEELVILDKKVKKCTENTAKLDDEYVVSYEQVEKSQKKLSKIRKLVKQYTVPSVLTYVQIKQDVTNVNKQIGIWKRRLEFEQRTYRTSCFKLAQLLGKRNANYLHEMIAHGTPISAINEWIFNLPSEKLKTCTISKESLIQV